MRLLSSHDSEELSCKTVTAIGFDIAKSVCQVHGVDAAGQVLIRRQLKRRYLLAFFQTLPPSLIGIEACPSSPIGRASAGRGLMTVNVVQKMSLAQQLIWVDDRQLRIEYRHAEGNSARMQAFAKELVEVSLSGSLATARPL
jgi:hypothetical protein